MQKGFGAIYIIVIILTVSILGVGLVAYKYNFDNIRQINSFEDCSKARYPVLKTYPSQCNTPNGLHFVDEQVKEERKEFTRQQPVT